MKDKLCIVAAVAIVALVVIGMWRIPSQHTDLNSNQLRILNDSVSHYRNKEGELISQRETLELTVSQFKSNLDRLEIDKEKLERQVGDLRRVNSVLRADLQASGTIAVSGTLEPRTTSDSFELSGVFSDSTEFIYVVDSLAITGMYDYLNDELRLRDIKGLSEISYRYNVSLEQVQYWKRDWLFGQRYAVVDLKLSDPNATITSLNHFQVKQVKRWWQRDVVKFGIGVFIGYKINNK